MKNVCEFCGEKINKTDIFCRGCGAKIENNEEVKDAVIEGNNPNKNTGFLLSIIVVLLIIISIVGLFLLFK